MHAHPLGLTPRRPELARSSLERLDAYASTVLGCPVDRARGGGVHLAASRARALPGWRGFLLPVVGLSYSEGAAIAVRPDLAPQLETALGSDIGLPRLDRPALRRLWRVVAQLLPHAFTLMGDMRAVDPRAFTPSSTEARAECIPRGDPAALDLRRRFDGEIFGVRGPQRGLVSWAALKLKSDDAWEIAVTTHPDYRGRGYARDVVSAATRHTLDQGRLCLYVHDHENTTSAFVSRSLGYRVYAEVVLGEY